MKKFIISLFIVSSFLSTTKITSQFESDVRLTNDTAVSTKCYNNAPGIAAYANFVHAVWSDFRIPANEKVFYKRSTDAGSTWEPDVQLTFTASSSVYPVIVVVGTVVHVAWQDHRVGGAKIFYIRSTDNGSTWGQEVQLSQGTTSFSELPSIGVSGSVLFVTWQDDRDGNWEIYYRCSVDGGSTWGQETRLTNDPATSSNTSVSVRGSVAHVAWVDNRDGNKEIYYNRSTDAGVSWGTDTRLTNDTAESNYPDVSVSNLGWLFVTWQDARNGWEIYVKRSGNGGASWEADTRLTNDPNNSFYPAIVAIGTNVHIVWQDVRDGNWEIYYKRSVDAGFSWTSDTRLTDSPFDSFLPSVAIYGSQVNVLWQDNRDGNWEMYYKRDPTGNPIGIINISSEIPRTFSLSQNYPNPFNPATNIKFQVPKQSFVNITVFDNLGREISTLVNRQLNPGTYRVDWNASNYPSGVYFYRLISDNYTETRKMILLK